MRDDQTVSDFSSGLMKGSIKVGCVYVCECVYCCLSSLSSFLLSSLHIIHIYTYIHTRTTTHESGNLLSNLKTSLRVYLVSLCQYTHIHSHTLADSKDSTNSETGSVFWNLTDNTHIHTHTHPR
jgi:hypothetical protein